MVENAHFDEELQRTRADIETLMQDARSVLGDGAELTIPNKLNELSDRMADLR